ncbi:MAG: hypothetical protein ABI305_07300, partial [Tepidiformaceae bacterium]
LAGQLRSKGWKAEYAAHPGRDVRGWLRLLPKLARADVLYLIGSRIELNSPQDLLLRVRRRPTVIHWVGTDVQVALDEAARGRASKRVKRRPTHWCDAPWLVDELRTIGVRAEHVALPIPIEKGEPEPLPEQFSVLLYLPVDAYDREVFDVETLMKLPAAFPEVAFTLIPSPADTLPSPAPTNLETPGYVADMAALYAKTTVLVRLTTHDGTSFMAVEAMSAGRYVIWSFPMEGAIRAQGFEAVSKALGGLLARHETGALGLNDSGRAFVLEAFDPERVLGELDRRLRALG